MPSRHSSISSRSPDATCTDTSTDDAEHDGQDGQADQASHVDDTDVAEREATEMTAYRERPPGAGSVVGAEPSDRWLFSAIGRMWKRNISLTVPHNDCRDHLANERTFLAYLRTSLALSMIGIVTTQLFRIEIRAPMYPTRVGYFDVGKPLGAAFQVAAMIMVMMCCHRFLRQQLSMARGKVWAGGWEIHTITGGVFLLLTGSLILMVGAEKIPKP